jgi:Family of unknown function (DUF6152)
MKKLTTIFATASLLVAAAFPMLAHHSFSAEFDAKKPVKLEGKVVKMEWVNPHSWLHLEVTKPDGTKEVWMVEGGSPGVMFRAGWNKNSLPAGIKVVVTGSAAKDGSLRANSRSIEFPDGRKLDTGSSQGKTE